MNKATRDIIWDWNIKTSKAYFNNRFFEITGYSINDLTINWFFANVHPEDVEKVKEELIDSFKAKIETWESEFRFRVAGGDYKYAFTRGCNVFDNEGIVYRVIGFSTDITEKRKLENKLITQQLNQQKLITETTIQVQEKLREQLSKELHDNINQILVTVKMFLNLAKTEEQMRDALLERSHDNVNFAIEEIMNLSRLLVALSLGDIGLVEASNELVDELNLTKGLDVKLVCTYLEEKHLDLGLKLMLFRIVQEKTDNIIKNSKATKPVITLAADPKKIFLSKFDNDIGFDPCKKAKGIGLKISLPVLSFTKEGTISLQPQGRDAP